MQKSKYDSDGYAIAENLNNDGLVSKPLVRIVQEVKSYFVADHEKLIFVGSNYEQNSDGGDAVALTENHPAHPKGEAFVAGKVPVQVALTEKVVEALNDGLILFYSDKEVLAAEADRAERVQRAIRAVAGKKNLYREKFVSVFGTEEGFEAAFEAISKREGLLEIMKDLRA
jgi:hypothetical protein